jgi:hypothetical protein
MDQNPVPSPVPKPIVVPGHVAQMQKLFQHAKASLRLDVRYASSPVGSIDSRLPNSPLDSSQDAAQIGQAMNSPGRPLSTTPSKKWRYSRAPGFLAGVQTDVREPFPYSSPQLPRIHPFDISPYVEQVAEPPSSGFSSPVNQANLKEEKSPSIASSPLLPVQHTYGVVEGSPMEASASDLQYPMTNLRMGEAQDVVLDQMDQSPIVKHLLRKSVETRDQPKDISSELKEEIVLSASVQAAADSAKLKRGLYTELFPKPPTHKANVEAGTPLPDTSEQKAHRCPDPLMHEGGPAVRCPDPTAHFIMKGSIIGGYGGSAPGSEGFAGQQAHTDPNQNLPLRFNRATATGSPMPLLKIRPPPPARLGARQGPWHPPNDSSSYLHPMHRHHSRPRPAYVATASEHFQPGWYYAKDSGRPSPQAGAAMYSFSTAAGKVVGTDPAPDSMIRDSYRTDTLTPLAKPPSRYRKNGINAIVSAHTTNLHYGPSHSALRPRQQRMWSGRSRLPEGMEFRSSPPRSSDGSLQSRYAKKRTRDLVSPSADILEDETAEDPSEVQSKLRLKEGEDMMQVDEETRAAVRMSVFGMVTPETASDATTGLKDMSPNVMLYRKGTRPSGSRKKRRPSYWDGDLEEVVRSPAARRVVSSPIKKDDVRSLQADVEFERDTCKDGLEGIRGDENASDGAHGLITRRGTFTTMGMNDEGDGSG